MNWLTACLGSGEWRRRSLGTRDISIALPGGKNWSFIASNYPHANQRLWPICEISAWRFVLLPEADPNFTIAPDGSTLFS